MDAEKAPSSYTDLINGVPLVGHIKGGMHYATGDIESGRAAMKAATRTSAVVAGGALVWSIAGPFTAFFAGAISGLTSDALITAYDTESKGTPQPYGTMEAVADSNDRGKLCKAATTVVVDGLVGYWAGSALSNNSVSVQDAVKKWQYIENLSYNKIQKAAVHYWKTTPAARNAVWNGMAAPIAWYQGTVQKKTLEGCCERCKW